MVEMMMEHHIPDEIYLAFVSYLSVSDLLRFSYSSRKLYFLFNEENFWKKKLHDEELNVSKQVQKIAKNLMRKKEFATQIPLSKLYGMILMKLQRNWNLACSETPECSSPKWSTMTEIGNDHAYFCNYDLIHVTNLLSSTGQNKVCRYLH